MNMSKGKQRGSILKKILILEDNMATMKYISSLLQDIDISNKVYECTNTKDAYQHAIERDIDLFITDIILETRRPGDSSGLSFVENIRKIDRYAITPVIFVTALEDSRMHSYEKLHCYSYLEKPFDPERLKTLVRQCIQSHNPRNTKKTLYFRKDGIIMAIDRDEIVYVECVNHLLHIITDGNEKIKIPYITIKKFMEKVDSNNFVQISRNTVVNLNYVRSVDFGNKEIVLKSDFGNVVIGGTYKKKLKEEIGYA